MAVSVPQFNQDIEEESQFFWLSFKRIFLISMGLPVFKYKVQNQNKVGLTQKQLRLLQTKPLED